MVTLRSERELPPPDFIPPLCIFKNPYLIAIRILFTFAFISAMAIPATLAPTFYVDRMLLCILATFLGLGIGSHYTDVLKDAEYFKTIIGSFEEGTIAALRWIGLCGGIYVGIYIAWRWSWIFLIFVLIEGFIAFSYSAEWPSWGHTYVLFALGWGFVPSLAAYYIQALTIDLKGLALAIFITFFITALLYIYEGAKKYSTSWLCIKVVNIYILGLYLTAITLVVWRVFF